MNITKIDNIFDVIYKALPHKRPFFDSVKGFEDLMTYKFDPRRYAEYDDLYLESFLRDLYRKREDINLEDVDPNAEAYKLFIDRERINGALNRHLPQKVDTDVQLKRILDRARRFCSEMLGSSPTEITPILTTGATTSLKKGTTPVERLVDGSVSKKLLESSFYNTLTDPWSRAATKNVIVDHDRLHYTPKTAFVSRLLGLPVTRDLAYQRGYGLFLRNAYAKWGYDISTLADYHRALALESSKTLEYATIDIENSSNSLYTTLIRYVFPQDHYDLMMQLRTNGVIINQDGYDIVHMYEMIGPNGNGFIFEMQCVLYWCILASIAVELQGTKADVTKISVFGDDLICEDDHADTVIDVLRRLGIVCNRSKTFTGNIHIRESCGIFAYHGTDIRGVPVYEEPTDCYSWTQLCNRIHDRYYDNNICRWRSRNMRAVWLGCARRIKPENRFWAEQSFGPEFLFDGRCRRNPEMNFVVKEFRKGNGERKYLPGWALSTPASESIRFSQIVHRTKATTLQQLIACCHEGHRKHGGRMVTEVFEGEKRRVWKYSTFTDPRAKHLSYRKKLLAIEGLPSDPLEVINDFEDRLPIYVDRVSDLRVLRSNFKWDFPYIWNQAQRAGYLRWWYSSPLIKQLDHDNMMSDAGYELLLAFE